MIYEVTPGVFVDGSIVDASDFLNEFGAVSSSISEVVQRMDKGDKVVAAEQKQYTDDKIANIIIDGGAF